MIFNTNIDELQLIVTVAHKNRHTWTREQCIKGEQLLAAVIRKMLAMGTFKIAYRNDMNQMRILDNVTMNPNAIAKAQNGPEFDDPIDVMEFIRHSNDIKFFNLDTKEWGEFMFEDLGVFELKEQLKVVFEGESAGAMVMNFASSRKEQ